MAASPWCPQEACWEEALLSISRCIPEVILEAKTPLMKYGLADIGVITSCGGRL